MTPKRDENEEMKCNIKTCPVFIGLFLEGQEMSGQAKEAMHKKLLKWFNQNRKELRRHL